jgi:hypothetical protein
MVESLIEHWRELAASFELALRPSGTLLLKVNTIKQVGWVHYNVDREGNVVKVSTTFKGDLGDRDNVLINMTMEDSIRKLDLDGIDTNYWSRTTIKPPKKEKDNPHPPCNCQPPGCHCREETAFEGRFTCGDRS